MKKKQQGIQLALVSIGILLIIGTYFYFPSIKKDKVLKDQSANKETCTHVALNKIWYTVSGAPDAPASLDWDATTDVTLLTLAYDNMFDFSTIGGLVNTEASGYTGDVLFVIPSTSDAGNEYTVWCEFIKYYEAPNN